MMHLPGLLGKSRTSGFYRWWLNAVLPWVVPFNRPHGFRVVPLPDGGMSVRVPYWRINRNHVNGIHACALATAAEMCSGLSVLEHVDPKQYRLIMRTMHMEYRFQAKRTTTALCRKDQAMLVHEALGALLAGTSVDHTSTVELHDDVGNHIATGTITWQVKPWSSVRTAR
jgi:acyl-coenzyme A thioesterase PaaI-like protein